MQAIAGTRQTMILNNYRNLIIVAVVVLVIALGIVVETNEAPKKCQKHSHQTYLGDYTT